MKIFLAVDGSEPSLAAVRDLIDRMGWFRGTPEIHVAFVNPAAPDGLVRSFISRDVIDAYYREEGEKMLAESCALLKRAKLAYKTHIGVGPVAETIVRLAKDHACDLVWMGTHGRGAAKTVALGSIAQRVLRHSEIPVLLVKGGRSKPQARTGKPTSRAAGASKNPRSR